MSTSYYQYQVQPTGSLPINVPGKNAQQPYIPRHTRNSSAYSQLSVSPPERAESVSTSSGAGLYSAASSSYAGSEYDSSTNGATSVDLLDYMNDRLAQAYNPIPMDHSLAKQAQM
jgi:biogenesis of lysosome-related organelles complex 1 subunit KXD1